VREVSLSASINFQKWESRYRDVARNPDTTAASNSSGARYCRACFRHLCAKMPNFARTSLYVPRNVLMPEAAGVIVCRICLDHEDTPSNPLLRPCRCRGSMAYVHRNCLNEWRRQSIHPNSIYQCDTCKFEYRFATAIGPDRFTIARVLAWPISIHLLSVMGLFCLCFAGGFVAKLFDASLTWSDFNLKSCFNIDHLLIGATAIGATVFCLLVLCLVLLWAGLTAEDGGITCILFGPLVLYECTLESNEPQVKSSAGAAPESNEPQVKSSQVKLAQEAHKGKGMVDTDVILVLAVVVGLCFVYYCLYFLILMTVHLSAREALEAGARATAAAQHVVLDVGGHDDEEDGEASGGSFDGGEDKEHGNVNAPHPLERQQLIARP